MLLKNVKVRWASVTEPNTKFEPCWEVEAILSSEQAAELADKQLTIKKDDEGNPIHRFKRKCQGTKRDGGKFDKVAPRVFNAAKGDWDGGLIGNGSVCNIQYDIISPTFMNQTFIKSDLVGIQVLEHVSFGEAVDEFEDEGTTTSIEGDDEPSKGEESSDDSPW